MYDKIIPNGCDNMKEIEYIKYHNYLLSLMNLTDKEKKYFDLLVLQRLKDVSILCGMEYASKDAYQFHFSVSRYTHCINVFLITYYLTDGDLKAALAGLFHDVGTPAFSHVVDYFNGDMIEQESTEMFTADILRNDLQLRRYLKEDNIDIEDVIDFKKYSIVDLARPFLCADRIDNIITNGMNWVGVLDFETAKNIIDSMCVMKNEQGTPEIGFLYSASAIYLTWINDRINELTHTSIDNYMMNLMANIIRLGIRNNLFNYEDLYTLTDNELVDILEENQSVDPELERLWLIFKTADKNNVPKQDIITKDRILNPLVCGKRLIY